MADSIQMPSGFGGLMRYQEEFESYLMLKPTYVIIFVILIILLRISLGFFLK
jgi:preprotein translocase subunit Sec61beta